MPSLQKVDPELAELYNIWNKNEKQVEIIFVKSDKNKEQFEEYLGEIPWLAIPFGDEIIKKIE